MIKTTYDGNAFNAAVRAIQIATKRDGSEILNRANRSVAMQAGGFTPRASAEAIQQELLDNKTALRIVTARLRAKIGTSVTIKRGKHAGKTRKISRVTRKQIGAAARRLIAKRKQGSGFLKAGWIPSIRALGGSPKGIGSLRSGGTASKGRTLKATPSKLAGEIENASFIRLKGTAQGATRARGESALAKAVRAVTAQNIAYAQKKIGETLQRHSDK